MEKLQYDSFYKFMVSAGIILIAAPLICLYFLLCNGNQILLSQTEYEALTTKSQLFVDQRDDAILEVLKISSWILGVLIAIGLFCLIYGIYKWRKTQKEIDEQMMLKTEEMRLGLREMSPREIAENAIREAEEDGSITIDKTCAQGVKEIQNKMIAETSPAVKYIEIENYCYRYIRRTMGVKFDVKQSVKFKHTICDIIAISKLDNNDVIFEVKYWTKTVTQGTLERTRGKLVSMKEEYENISQRNCTCNLMVVTSDAMKEAVQACCDQYMAIFGEGIDISVNTESEICKVDTCKNNCALKDIE